MRGVEVYLQLFFTLALGGGEFYIKLWYSVISIDVYANTCFTIKLHFTVKFYFIRYLCSVQGCYILAFTFMYVNIQKSKLHHFQLYSSNTFGFFSTACVAFLGFVPGVNFGSVYHPLCKKRLTATLS
jgi:hypothetical protein